MSLKRYYISKNNNILKISEAVNNEVIYSSFWFMEFGKTCAEIKNAKNEVEFSITKKFQFWKWRMVYLISQKTADLSILIAQNTRYTVFKLDLLSGNYEIKVHYKKKKSIFKDGEKIAEFDESFTNKRVELLVLNTNELKIIFLLYACLLVGENEFKSKYIIKSQKQLETNENPWF